MMQSLREELATILKLRDESRGRPTGKVVNGLRARYIIFKLKESISFGLMNCPHCDKELEFDFWDKYDNNNPFPCEYCGGNIYLIFEEYFDEETGEENTCMYLSKTESW